MSSLHEQRRIRPLSLAVALALPVLALAQQQSAASATASTAAAATSTTDSGVQTVDVKGKRDTKTYLAEDQNTATPLNLSIRETPQSVSVVTAQRIADQNLQTITDVVNNVTGVAVHQYETNRAQFTARGFDINTLMIDGVPTSWDQSWSSGEIASSLAIYDRVEVVRGATGLTTGAGDPGAAINLVRKRADSKSLAATGELGVGSWDQRRALVDLSTPLNADKTIRARVVGEYSASDSETDLLKSKTRTLYATFEADLTPSTLLSAGASRQVNDPRGSMWGGLPVFYADGTRTNWDRSKTTSSNWVRWKSTYDNYFAGLEHRFDSGWNAKLSVSHGNRDSDARLSYLSGAPDRSTGAGMSYFDANYLVTTKQDDAALQVSGPFTLFGRKHEASFGVVWSKQDFVADQRAGDYGSVADFNTWTGSTLAEPAWGDRTHYGSSTTKQKAFYAATHVNVADPVKLVLGARVTDFSRDFEESYETSYNLKVSSQVTPYAGITWDLSDTLTAYASYTDIFQSQSERSADGKTLDPVKGKAFEAGVKGSFLNGKLNALAAVFDIRQDNLAIATGDYFTDSSGSLTQEQIYRAGQGIKSTGFELEASGEFAPGWNGTAGYSQFRAKENGSSDVNPIYPRKELRLFTTWRVPALSELTVGGGANWESTTYTIADNPLGVATRIEQPAFTLVNLMARYQFSKQLSLQMNVDNVTDRKYFRMFDAYDQLTFGTGRTLKATARYAF
jgi:outer membrane receptor for ferric coprogen and ferric-rhodotorulic acid